MELGDYVMTRRKELRLSLRQLAQATAVDAAYLSRVEQGKVAPSTHLLQSLAEALQLDRDELDLLAGRVPEAWLNEIRRGPSAAATLRAVMRSILAEAPATYQPAVVADGGDRAIEDGFPFEAISQIGEAESWRKEIYRPIYHMHKWWAQRLGSVFRAILLACASPYGTDVREVFYQPARLPGMVVLDPFMGSGTTIGEALKLGCIAIGRDINPVAYAAVRAALGPLDRRDLLRTFRRLEATVGQELRALYAGHDSRGRACDVLYYFWVKRAPCPSCGHHVDLFPSYIFARHAYPSRRPDAFASCPACSTVISTRYDAQSIACPNCALAFNPQRGPAKKTTAVCTVCGREFPIMASVKSLDSPPWHRMYAKLVLTTDGRKEYLPIDERDRQVYRDACARLSELEDAYPIAPIHDGYNTRQVLNYGYRRWHEMFNERQLLALALLGRAIAELSSGQTRDALACLYSGTLEFNTMFASYKGEGTGAVRHMFSHHILKPERMPLEANVWGTPKSSGSFSTLFESRLLRALDYRQAPFEVRVSDGSRGQTSEKVFGLSRPMGDEIADSYEDLRARGLRLYLSCGDSRALDLPDTSVDLVVTDPPFFDNVHYSELADFFYVWQQHFFGMSASDDRTTRHTGEVQHKDADVFARKLGGVFTECCRVLKDNGLLVFTYHHARDEGWLAVAEAVLTSGLRFVQAQPVKAEMSGATPKSAAKEPIDLDVIFVCRKWQQRRRLSGASHDHLARAQALAQIKRFNAVGRHLSRNDVRVIVMGQLLVEASALRTPAAALQRIHADQTFSDALVKTLYDEQCVAERRTPSGNIRQAALFA